MSGENRIAERVDAVGNRANGVAAHYEYAPFGEVTAQVRRGGVTTYDFAALNPWRFSSEYADDASTTVYYNYRHYEPVTGRWLSRYPMEEDGGICLYAYCNNKTIDRIDVRGDMLFIPIIFAKALAYTMTVMATYQATVCFYATHDMQLTETDAYRHCYISCAYSKCMEDFTGKYMSQLLSMIGGLFWEIVDSFSDDGSFSIEDLKSDLIGVMENLDYSSCNEACKCEKGKNNPK